MPLCFPSCRTTIRATAGDSRQVAFRCGGTVVPFREKAKPMFELYHHNTAVCAQKVRLVLEEKEQPWTGHELNLRLGDQVRPEYLKLNPNGVVPHNPLKPRDPKRRVEMRLWTKSIDEGLHYAISSLSFAVLQRDAWLAKPREELDRHLDSLPDPARRERQREAIDKGLDAPIVQSAIRSYFKAALHMEAVLS